jgi:hypothetical protein
MLGFGYYFCWGFLSLKNMSLDASFFFFFLRELERKRVVCFDFLSLKGGSNVHREREREREAMTFLPLLEKWVYYSR